MTGVQTCALPISDLSIAGDKSDQKDAAIITPALKPKIVFKNFLFKSLKKQTVKAPKAVIPQVKVVAINACHTGLILLNQSNFYSPLLINYE